MDEKKLQDMEDLMLDYGEMTSFNFNSMDYKQVQELQKIADSEYANQPYTFKYGNFEGERNERYFTDFTIETFSDFIKEVPEIYIEEKWISTDVRPGRNKEKWLNLILRKKDS